MTKIYSREGARNKLARMVADPIYYNLYQNDFTPDQDTEIGDLVVADFDGYAGPTASSGWATPVTASGHAKTAANILSWTHSGGATDNVIYGYYETDQFGNMLAVERFATPITMEAGAPPLQLIPVETFISEVLS